MTDSTFGYTDFFRLKHVPFSASIPPDALFMSPQMQECLSRLRFAAENNKFAVLTGPVGTGKSTTLHAFNHQLDPNRFLVLYVSESNLTPRWLYSVPLRHMKIKAKFFVNESKRQFHEALLEEVNVHGRKIVLIIDEAHLMISRRHGRETLEEIRFLLNFSDFDSGSQVCLVLCGQDELWELLDTDSSRAITQRIDLLCRTRAFDERQVALYMAAHMRYAQAQDKIFSDEAVSLISSLSGGVARLINKICSHALIYAASQENSLVSAEIVNTVVQRELPQGMLRQ